MGHLTVDEAKRFLAYHSCPVPAFVETGTHIGTTLYPIVNSRLFSEVHSIELSEELYERAKGVVGGDERVTLHRGDSAVIMTILASTLETPTFFWLDAHWYNVPEAAKGNPMPLLVEVAAISLRRQADIIAIDDVQCFGRKWAEGPAGDWTDITEDVIVGMLGRSRVEKSYVDNYKLVVHRRAVT